eukprot:SAG11_NODE_1345_length_5147_cov_3.840729_1_plen_67_part_00
MFFREFRYRPPVQKNYIKRNRALCYIKRTCPARRRCQLQLHAHCAYWVGRNSGNFLDGRVFFRHLL